MDNEIKGLSKGEVEQRIINGQINRRPDKITKPLSRILSDNLLTFFNLFNVIIAAALVAVGSYRNLTFFVIISANVVIGIVQEIRTKKTLEKLSLISAAKAHVIRDGQTLEIPADDIVLDDWIRFESGDQICVDGAVKLGSVEVNESLLTGEADPIVKREGDKLLSGSFIVSGSCVAVAEKVGGDSYAAKLAEKAKKYKKLDSKLMKSIDKIIKIAGMLVVPVGALMLWRSLSAGISIHDTVTDIAAALIGMMPQGLVLLTTVSLVVGVMRLARHKTLVQELYCIETLSRVDTLCLDKTGTITKGSMEVSEVIDITEFTSEHRSLAASALHALDDKNATAMAMKAHFKSEEYIPASDLLPFSSSRKYSAAAFREKGCIFFGAPEILLPQYRFSNRISQLMQQGKRMLLIAFSPETDFDTAAKQLTPLAVAVLEDQIRENAGEVLSFFKSQDVDLKIISGDNPVTVSAIAKKAGFEDYDRFVDASTLDTPEKLAAAAEKYTIFGRVMPEQKKELVAALKEAGHTVAMTGDGVNDVLALKEADCSIAVAAGSDAAKQVAQLVLLDSDFASLPQVVMEGRRVINNITRTASLFLVKTTMSLILALCTIIFGFGYPFEPIQLSLIGLFAESIPGFFLALEPNRERVRGNFLKTVFSNSLPSGIMICVFTLLTEFLISPLLGLNALQNTTLAFYIMGFIWLIQLFRICKPFTLARRIMWCGMVTGFYGGALLLHSLLFNLVIPSIPMLLSFAVMAAAAALLDKPFYMLFKRIIIGREVQS